MKKKEKNFFNQKDFESISFWWNHIQHNGIQQNGIQNVHYVAETQQKNLHAYMLLATYHYLECHSVKCHSADCHYAESHFNDYHKAECLC